MIRNLGEKYSPLYFLAALGFGGTSVFFFMYFMFLTPHPQTPIPTFESIAAAWATGPVAMQAAIAIAYVGMSVFALGHLGLLAWNLSELAVFKRTPAYQGLLGSNARVTLMAVPLTLGMTINTLFVTSATLIPGLWNVIEYLFPLALAAFAAVGWLAFRTLKDYLGRILTGEGFAMEKNNGLNQLLAVFALAMIAVGFSASAAMSTVQATVVIGFIGSLVFATAAIGLFLLVVPVGFASMLRHGLGVENSPTLWMTVPIVTLLGIMFMRDFHGFATLSGFAGAEQPGTATLVPFVVLSVLLAFQTVVFMFGKAAMNRNGYLRRFVYGREASAGSFGLVCPGVAYGVLGFFWLHAGLVGADIVERNSAVYFAILAGLLTVQLVTIAGTLKLVSNNLLTRRTPAAATADTAAEAPAQVPAPASV